MGIAVTFGIGLIIGLLMVYGYFKSQEYQLIRQAKMDAEDLLTEAKDQAKEQLESVEESCQSSREEKIQKCRESLSERWSNVEDQRAEISSITHETDEKIKALNTEYSDQLNVVKRKESKVQKKEDRLKSQRERVDSLRSQFVAEIEKHHEFDKAQLCQERAAELEKEFVRNTTLRIKADMEWLKDESESEAQKILCIVLNRFSREFCSERGLSAITFPSDKVANNFMKSDINFVEQIEGLCGVDLVVAEDERSIAVAGFDPVRRELARRILLKLVAEGRPKKNIEAVYTKCKKELFNQIDRDGNKIAKELKLRNVSQEIRKMMGCLRYRYSFSQNQYFHCAEVGWLCGLLASELSLHLYDARRSGLLHDIGKSMDHSIEGGHAVIGADFIEKHGERAEIVHNVRAHHFDIQPETDVAFLVIGADALSGGRPGARRSTIDSYNQKIIELEKIGNSHSGVLSTYIVHGGREVRIIADGEKVDDLKSVDIAKKVAAEIEETCNYPGQIKVVVVRESVATQMTGA